MAAPSSSHRCGEWRVRPTRPPAAPSAPSQHDPPDDSCGKSTAAAAPYPPASSIERSRGTAASTSTPRTASPNRCPYNAAGPSHLRRNGQHSTISCAARSIRRSSNNPRSARERHHMLAWPRPPPNCIADGHQRPRVPTAPWPGGSTSAPNATPPGHPHPPSTTSLSPGGRVGSPSPTRQPLPWCRYRPRRRTSQRSRQGRGTVHQGWRLPTKR